MGDAPSPPTTPVSVSDLARESPGINHGPSSMLCVGFKSNSVTDLFIEFDVEKAITMDFEFLLGIGAENLPMSCGDPNILKVIEAGEELGAQYDEIASDETTLHQHSCDLAIGFPAESVIDVKMTIVRIDPGIIQGNADFDHSPDVVVVRQSVAEQEETPMSWDDITKVYESDYLWERDQFHSVRSRRHKKGSGLTKVTSMRSGLTGSSPSQMSAECMNKKRKADADAESSRKKQKAIVHKGRKIKLACCKAHQFSVVFHPRNSVSLIEIEDLHGFVAPIKALANQSPTRLGNADWEEAGYYLKLQGSPSRRPPRLLPRESSRPKYDTLKPDGADGPESPLTLERAKIVVGGPIMQRPPFATERHGYHVRAAYVVDTTWSQQTGKLMKIWWQLKRHTREWGLLEAARNELEEKVKDDEKLKGLSDSLPKLCLKATPNSILADASFGVLAKIYENFDKRRVLSALVFETFPKHLHKVEKEAVFRKCFREIFQAHYWIYQTTQILHRDISVDNLMGRECPGGYQGVLMDWDLAEDQKNDPTMDHTGTRTSTREFMSVELHLGGPHRHKIRYDWESFFYYLLWTTFVLHADVNEVSAFNQMRNELKDWIVIIDEEVADPDAFINNKLFNAKTGFLTYMKRERYISGLQNAQFGLRETYDAWIEPLYRLFGRAYLRKNQLELEVSDPRIETLDGFLTYENIWDILKEKPPA